jgi:enamine deaminase RidA (YjgF/YER057c/UK114 family)
MSVTPVEPEGWPRPRGYSNGMLAPVGGRLLFVAGQIGWDAAEQIVSDEIAAQFEQALRNVVAVVAAAGGRADHIARLTIYVTDRQAYVAARKEIGASYRAVMGRHFPTMALVVVVELLEPRARVEIEATAVLPPEGSAAAGGAA